MLSCLWLQAGCSLLLDFGGARPPDTTIGETTADSGAVIGDDVSARGDAGAAPLGSFGAVAPIGPLVDAAAEDDDPSVTADLLELYFNSTRAGGPGAGDIWVSRRGSPEEPWGPPQVVVELSTAAAETTPTVSGDGLELVFGSQRAGGQGGFDLWWSSRASRTAPWAPPVLLTALNSPFDDVGGAITGGGLELVFSSNRPLAADPSGAASDSNLFHSQRASTAAAWPAPLPLAALNSAASEGCGSFDASGLYFLFSSNRPGGAAADPGPAAPDQDIYAARRAAAGAEFSAPVLLDDISTAQIDSDPGLSADGRYLVFSSDRGGTREIYEARR